MIDIKRNIFIVGIKGAAMSHIAVFLKALGKSVTGADTEEVFITDRTLEEQGIAWKDGFADTLPNDTDLVIYSAAHGGRSNPYVKQALDRGTSVMNQPQALDELMSTYTNKIAVAGCHGKTTTSSLLAYALSKLGKDPGYIIGVPSFGPYPGSAVGKNGFFVIEADEYGVNPPEDTTPKLLLLHPDTVLCTNIDFDHPDVYRDLEHTKETFLSFFKDKKLNLCIDDPVIRSVIPRLNQRHIVTFGFHPDASVRVSGMEVRGNQTYFKVRHLSKEIGEFSIRLFGSKNVSNAAGVLAVLLGYGFAPAQIRDAMADFAGPKRRFEHLGTDNGVDLFDDYGHHPAEISATIAAARNRFPERRIVVIFQPHTYSRTKALLGEFSEALGTADTAYLLPIFPSARERSVDFAVTSDDIVVAAGKKTDSLRAFGSREALLKTLRTEICRGDVIILMGAGDVYMLQNDIIGYMKGISRI